MAIETGQRYARVSSQTLSPNRRRSVVTSLRYGFGSSRLGCQLGSDPSPQTFTLASSVVHPHPVRGEWLLPEGRGRYRVVKRKFVRFGATHGLRLL